MKRKYCRIELTVFPVVKDFKVFLLAGGECLPDDVDGMLAGERSMHEVTGGGTLHHFSTTEPRQAAEPVRAVDYMTGIVLEVGYQETAVYNTTNNRNSILAM